MARLATNTCEAKKKNQHNSQYPETKKKKERASSCIWLGGHLMGAFTY